MADISHTFSLCQFLFGCFTWFSCGFSVVLGCCSLKKEFWLCLPCFGLVRLVLIVVCREETSFGCSTLLHVVSLFLVYVVESCYGCSTSFKLFCTVLCWLLQFFCGCCRIGSSGSRLPEATLRFGRLFRVFTFIQKVSEC